MKSTTYARLTLFLPYLLLIGAVLYLYFPNSDSPADSLLLGISFVWFFLAIFWTLPYSILVACLILWSRGKTMKQIQSVYALAPFALMIITLITYSIVYVVASIYYGDFWEGLSLFAMTSLISIPASLILGYGFVGISLLAYRLLTRTGFLKEQDAQEAEFQPISLIPPA